MKSRYVKNRIFDLINEEIDLRGKVENKNVTYEYGETQSSITFSQEKDRPNWKILKEDYSYIYHWLVDSIFDEIHPY